MPVKLAEAIAVEIKTIVLRNLAAILALIERVIVKIAFSETERKILSAFKPDSNFFINDTRHRIILSGKPSVKKGECKTDIYVKTICSNNIEHEFKISVKQENADFLKNKISLERANQILGVNSSNIIKKSILSIVDKFKNTNLLNLKNGPTIMMGWKFEFMNKISEKNQVKLNLISLKLMISIVGKI